jgi:hypothetical protein
MSYPDQGPAVRRPGVVTAAAVMAFVEGGLLILIHLFFLLFLLDTLRREHFAISHVFDASNTKDGVFALFRLALGALFIWGGIAALKGRTRTVLVVVSVIEAIFSLLLVAFFVLSIIGAVLAPLACLELIFVSTILGLILRPQSRDFFRARSKAANQSNP